MLGVLGLGISRLRLLSTSLFTAGRWAGLRQRLCRGASALGLIRSCLLRCLSCRRLRCLARVRAGGPAAVHDLPGLAGLGDRRILIRSTGSAVLLPGSLSCSVHILRRCCSTLLLLRVIRRLLGASCLRGLLHGWLLRLGCCLLTGRNSALCGALPITLVRCLLARLTGLARLSGLCGLTSLRGLTSLSGSIPRLLWLLLRRALRSLVLFLSLIHI